MNGYIEICESDLIAIQSRFGDKLSMATRTNLDHYIQAVEAATSINRFNRIQCQAYSNIFVCTRFLVKLKSEVDLLEKA